MKKLLYLVVPALLLTACGSSSKKQDVKNQTKNTQPNHIEVLYFHAAQRCMTCRSIEANVTHLLDSLYTTELQKGKITYKIIDISKSENEAIANKYQVSWSSLFINRWKDGKESTNNLTRFSFSNARTAPEKFNEGIKTKIDELLKQL